MTQIINPLLTPENYEKYLKSIQLPYERDTWQIEIGKQKIRLKDEPLYLRETVDRRGRGASKTFDTMEQNLFLAVIGYRGIWFSSGRDQLEQPKIYLRYIIDRSPLLRSQISELLKERVLFKSGGSLKLKNLTELNARSGRADFITYDEEAQADPDAYNAAVSILAGSNLGFVFHISTPAKATVFEENYERIRRRERETGVKLTFRVIWDQASWLRAKSEWYEEQRRIQPSWYFRQEHEASFELPSGAVFQNVIYTDIPSWIQAYDETPLCSGIDWNPVAGHWLVGGRWLDNDEAFVVQHTINLGVGYTHQLNDPKFPSTAKIYSRIRKYFMHGKRLCVEDGGINMAYCDWLREQRSEDGSLRDDFVTYEEWDAAGLNKTNAVLDLQSVRLYVDERLFPELAKQVADAHWKEDADRPELAKDKADSPHGLDALLHAVSPSLKRGAYIYREEW